MYTKILHYLYYVNFVESFKLHIFGKIIFIEYNFLIKFSQP